jgi:hypothetical protein
MRTAWLALLLLGSISAVAAMLTGSWRTPAAADAMPEQAAALVEPVDDTSMKTPNWPEVATRQEAARQELAARQAVDPDPSPVLRGSELPATTPYPAAENVPNMNTNANVNLRSRHWHDANAGTKMPVPMPVANAPVNPQQIKRIRDSKAEMRAKRSKAAAIARTCQAPNPWTGLLQKLSLAPATRCTI